MTPRFLLRTLAAAVLVLTILTGCGGDEVSLDPPEITYGEDISEMGMFVVDPRFTAAALPEGDDDWLLFDDLGELFKYYVRFPDAEFRAVWVNDYHTEEWLSADEATYVQSAGFSTPMGWLVGAFASADEAHAFSHDHGGDVMTWDQARQRHWDDPPGPDHPLHAGNDPGTPVSHQH